MPDPLSSFFLPSKAQSSERQPLMVFWEVFGAHGYDPRSFTPHDMKELVLPFCLTCTFLGGLYSQCQTLVWSRGLNARFRNFSFLVI